MQDNHYLVPQNTEGVATDITHSMPAETTEDAEDLFVDAKDRLLDVNNWAKYGNLSRVHFRLADHNGHPVSRHMRRTDHIVIHIDGSDNAADVDWFTIDALEYDDYPDQNAETFAIRLSPTQQTGTGASTAGNAGTDTSTIVVERQGVSLIATYHGRNNITDESDVWHGLEVNEWQQLMNGLLEYF